MMPIFMDRHEAPGLTAAEAAEGHKEDVKVQHKYGCHAFTYWFDAEQGNGFCLIDAPNKESVIKMHDEAHGGVPNQIIEVDINLVEAFLGRIKDPDAKDENELLKLIGPAFRVIMVTEFKDTALMKSKLGSTKSIELLGIHSEWIEKSIEQFEGRQVEHFGNSIIASFVTACKSLECALEIQKHFRELKQQGPCLQMDVATGLSAGTPVTDTDVFFGDAVPSAKRLAYIAGKNQVVMSSAVRDQYNQESLETLSEKGTVKALNPQEEKLLNRLMDIAAKIWNQQRFKVDDFGKQIGISKSQLYRHTISLTGYSPSEFLKEYKLNKALELIERQKDNIAQIALETGFNNPSYFSKCFYQRFGILPRDFAQSIA
jgi:AraC-like DNA-binding protein